MSEPYPIGNPFGQLNWMKKHGSSVLLNWGEDNNLWECSWISGGKRYSGFSTSAALAIREALEKARPCELCENGPNLLHPKDPG